MFSHSDSTYTLEVTSYKEKDDLWKKAWFCSQILRVFMQCFCLDISEGLILHFPLQQVVIMHLYSQEGIHQINSGRPKATGTTDLL